MNGKPILWKWLCRLVVVVLLPGISGCVQVADYTLTGNLWSADYDPDRHFATTNSVPGLFQTKDGKDIMVRYTEGRDRNFGVQRRAYLLHKNQALIDAGKRPDFVNAKRADKLMPIPMLSGSDTNGAADVQYLHGVLAADGQHFSLFLDGRESGPYALPAYVTGDRRAERLLLTPLTVAGDIVIYSVVCGAIAGVAFALLYASGKSN